MTRDRKDLSSSDQTTTIIELAIRLGVLALLLYWSFLLVQPFISIVIWSAVLTVALYPIFAWISFQLGGRRRLAAALTTILSLLVIIGPATWLALGLIDSFRAISDQLDLSILRIPPPANSVKEWPLIGEPIYQFWELASTNFSAALAKIVPQLKPLGGRLLRVGADTGLGTIKFLVSIVIAGFLFLPAPAIVGAVKRLARRLNPAHREEFRGSSRRDHSRRFARRHRHFGSAGLAGRHRSDGGRHSPGQLDHVCRAGFRNTPDWTFGGSDPGHHLELDAVGQHNGASVHGIHGAGQSA